MKRTSIRFACAVAGMVLAGCSSQGTSGDGSVAGTGGTNRRPAAEGNLAGVTRPGVDSAGLAPLDLRNPAAVKADFAARTNDTVLFEVDSSSLTQEARTQLEQQVTWLNTHPTVPARIEGHADELGTREYNLALGERRAQAVKEYLVARGIRPTTLTTVTYGKERPVAVGSDPASRARNRRAVTVPAVE